MENDPKLFADLMVPLLERLGRARVQSVEIGFTEADENDDPLPDSPWYVEIVTCLGETLRFTEGEGLDGALKGLVAANRAADRAFALKLIPMLRSNIGRARSKKQRHDVRLVFETGYNKPPELPEVFEFAGIKPKAIDTIGGGKVGLVFAVETAEEMLRVARVLAQP